MTKSKPWNQQKSGRAPKESRERRKVLIFCEDTKSSCLYFQSFPIDSARFEVRILGTGMNTDSLVEAAIRKVQQARRNGVIYSKVWCVFDRDSFPLENYARAFQIAGKSGIKIAWANEAFELWYILHFDYLETALSRHDYAQKLQQRRLVYDKADKGIYEKLKDRQETAIKNAQKLEAYWNQHEKKFPERENPSINVHELVCYLNELAELPGVAEEADLTPLDQSQ